MPANKKYFSSPIQRIAKITAGFVGGYLVTETFHMFLMLWMEPKNIMTTLRFGGFILWCALMIVAFLAKNGWKVWALYLLLSLLFYTCVYFFN
ncbi:hypothetical protein [Wenyingzhuangia sp. IMCC45467]